MYEVSIPRKDKRRIARLPESVYERVLTVARGLRMIAPPRLGEDDEQGRAALTRR